MSFGNRFFLVQIAVLLLIEGISSVAIGPLARCAKRGASCRVGGPPNPGVPNCTEHTFEQRIDHFSWAPTPNGETTYNQRYFLYDKYWKKGGPIFFYCGNEANVELYINSTGLMWENAETFGALLFFAEHRYYGQSLPFGKDTNILHYLTMEQALADYTHLLFQMKRKWDTQSSPVIAFGGSYGGMLAAWLRMKYPGTVDGAIAASAPILAFAGETTEWDNNRYWQVVTHDATAAAGASDKCAENVRQAWPTIFQLGETIEGRQTLSNIFRLCQPLNNSHDVQNLAMMHLNAWDTMAMGNFPYPSNYLIYQQTQNPDIMLPAFPVRVACTSLNQSFTDPKGLDLLAAMRDAGGVFYNVTGATVDCYDLPSDPEFDGIWDYQWCTEMLPQETYFAMNGVKDMFWEKPFNMSEIREHCKSTLHVEPREEWIATEFAGVRGASNIVFSNGLYDPWSSGGVLKVDPDSTLQVVIIPEGAHHLDLMFSNPADPASVLNARKVELDAISKWIKEAREIQE